MEEILAFVLENQMLTKLTLSKPADKTVVRTTGRLTKVKGQVYLALERFYEGGKTAQENIPVENAPAAIAALLPGDYKQLNIVTPAGNCEVKASKKGKITVIDQIRRETAAPVSLEHNRKKRYILPEDEAVDFLVALGVQDAQGFVYEKKRPKFRQINRFLELLSDVADQVETGEELYILDLCCGKSYLSFAVYYYFTVIRKRSVVMDGVDLKKDVMDFCEATARRLHYDGLHFTAGDIRDFPIRRKPDLTVSLHACDIATDIVLSKAMDSGSRVILSTPCCHHEMNHQLQKTGGPMDAVLEHSILRQKLADAVTDALRCKMLEIHGYEVQALELIDPEETPKNVLIRAVFKGKPLPIRREKLVKEYEATRALLNVEPYLYKNPAALEAMPEKAPGK